MRLILPALLAPALLLAQIPRIGVIDFYGQQRVSEERLRKLLKIQEGDRLPASKAKLEERLEQLPEVVRAHVAAVCCEGDRAILYIGIEEKGAPRFQFRYPPRENVSLPEEIAETYRRFLNALEQAVRRGEAAEDLSRGYSLMADPACRRLQEQFRAFAEENVALLRQVLRTSMHEEQRAIAAHVIGYAPRQSGVVDDLQYAMQDADETVRNNAMRALGAIAVLAGREPDLGLRISPTWFVEMLNSIVWSDRNKAAMALVHLTESRTPSVLEHLRERALPALVQMARWKSLGHALPAFILVGRLAGLPEPEIHAAWERGEREKVIRMASPGGSK
ncbi:MAG: HEAT repeat domain-containing protein [Acidobacteriota bacterium]